MYMQLQIRPSQKATSTKDGISNTLESLHIISDDEDQLEDRAADGLLGKHILLQRVEMLTIGCLELSESDLSELIGLVIIARGHLLGAAYRSDSFSRDLP